MKTGYPATIFIDEADAILQKRGTGISSDVNNTIVPMFLTEMDGLNDSSAFIILATNRPDILDPAVMREGRIDRRIKVSRPNKKAVEEILRINFRNYPLVAEVEELVTATTEGILEHGLESNISGAMVAGLVEQAVSEAISRDMDTKKTTGLSVDDIRNAISSFVKRERQFATTTPVETPNE